jgi:hypothetical protein
MGYVDKAGVLTPIKNRPPNEIYLTQTGYQAVALLKV